MPSLENPPQLVKNNEQKPPFIIKKQRFFEPAGPAVSGFTGYGVSERGTVGIRRIR